MGKSAADMGKGLRVENLAFAYSRNLSVFSDVSFTLHPGQVCAILGPNGAGKTTLLNCIGGYLSPSKGRVLIDGSDISTLSSRERANRLGLVAQLTSGGTDLEVLDYLVLGKASCISLLGTPTEQDYARAETVMREFCITHLRGKTMDELSGGERQQVEIASALVQDPDVILMDEPTNHLDFGNQHKVLRAVRGLAEKEEKAVLLTTHMPDHALLLGDLAAVMDGKGGLVVGPVKQVVTEEALSVMYETEVHIAYVEAADRVACVSGGLD